MIRTIFNVLTWIQIVLFGLFIGSGFGLIFWLKNQSQAYMITAIIFSACGLALGILRAEYVRKNTPPGGFYANTLFKPFLKRKD